MWQDKLKKLKKETNLIRKLAAKATIDDIASKPQIEIKFSDYCQQNKIAPLIQDTIEPHTRKPDGKPKPTLPEPQLSLGIGLGIDFFDEENSDLIFYRYGQRKLPQELRMNKYKIQATLELHNLNKAHAVDLLTRFIEQSSNTKKCVKIIHGQGTNSPYNQPVLLNMVRKLLKHMPQVIGYSYGAPEQGGNGVTIIKLSQL